MLEVLNHPIKYSDQNERLIFDEYDFNSTTIFLVCVNKSSDYDYSLNQKFHTIAN
jgi:hypothetical protein